MGTEVTDRTFTDVRGASPTPIVLEFFAPWCGNCRRIAPVLETLHAEYEGLVRLLTVNVEENPELVARYDISSTPTLVALAGDDPVVRVVGAQTEGVLRDVFTAAAHGSSPVAAASWVPRDACALPSADQPTRLDEFGRVFATALESVERRGPTWLRLAFVATPLIEEQVRDLAAREAKCCDFFDFDIVRVHDALVLDVRVPPAHIEVLAGMEMQAASANAEAVGTGSRR